jgi:hypothetical protein
MTGVVPPGYLVTPAQLSRYNVPSTFLAQFALRTFTLQVIAGGALGTMQFAWQYAGDNALSAPIVSVAGATWAYTLDDTFADLTFAARTYVLGETYAVDPNGVVTGAVGLTAARFSRVQSACSSVTAEALTLMRDAIRPPLTSWGDDAVLHAAQMAYAVLLRGVGATPSGAGVGDDNVFLAEKIGRDFFKSIGEDGKPDNMSDSSSTADGPLIPAYPSGDEPRGW